MTDSRSLQKQFKRAIASHDALALAHTFRLPRLPATKGSGKPRKHDGINLVIDTLDVGALFVALLDAVAAAESGHAMECYEAQARVQSNMNRVISATEGNWLVPALVQVCKETHKVAFLADKANTNARQQDASLQSAVQLLQDSYSKTFNDRKEFIAGAPFDTEGSKKAGVLAIVNELFAMYFRLNILRLCKNLIRPVESKMLNENGVMGDMVTYRYYIGRLNMFEDQHVEAEKNLQYSFHRCHRNAFRNKKRVLKYLVPVKMLRGRLPSPALLDKYGLDEFKPLVKGLQTGDLRTYQDGLIKYQDRFIRQGTYLLLEKCKTVCYRNLLKRVHKILEKHQVPLAYVTIAFKYLGMSIDLDEVECILANLIYRGFIRGYLSHSKRVLVLSKRDPFPTAAVILK